MIDKEKFYLKSELARELGLTWDSLKARIAALIPTLTEKHGYNDRQKILSPAICSEIVRFTQGEKTENSEVKESKPE